MKKFKEIKMNASNSNALLDKALQLTGLRNDAALSRALEVAPPVLSKIRHGHLPVGATLTIALHEVTGMSIAEIKEILIDEVAE